MTLIDLIRKLHKERTLVLDYEVFTTTDNIGIDDAIYRWDVNPHVMRFISWNFNPGSMELGDKPDYLICHSAEEYEERTYVLPPKGKYPRILVCVSIETMTEFSNRWKGHYWRDIPPLELQWSEVSYYNALPRLSKDGIFIGYQTTFPDERDGSYYVLRDNYGNNYAWGGDLINDGLPDGLYVDDAEKFI